MPEPDPSKIMTFATPKNLCEWLKDNHATKSELWVKIFKKNTGVQSVTWNNVVIESLCWGWIDGIKKSIDEQQKKAANLVNKLAQQAGTSPLLALYNRTEYGKQSLDLLKLEVEIYQQYIEDCIKYCMGGHAGLAGRPDFSFEGPRPSPPARILLWVIIEWVPAF